MVTISYNATLTMSERELSPYTESVEVQDDNNNGLPSPAHPSISTTLDEVDLLLHQDTVDKVSKQNIALIQSTLMASFYFF